jgi:hypothetical protein
VQQTHVDRAQALDAEYDKQTDHSRDGATQQRWDLAISTALADPRSATILTLKL